MNLLAAVAKGFAFDFSDSPLSLPLSEAELEYHSEQMKGAPIHPDYGW